MSTFLIRGLSKKFQPKHIQPIHFRRLLSSNSTLQQQQPNKNNEEVPLRHVRTISDLKKEEIELILLKSMYIKNNKEIYKKSLLQKTLLMLFEKPSLRTRVSFETGMTELGGHAIFYSTADSPIGEKETFEDTGKVLSRYVDVIMARVKTRKQIFELSKYSTKPVINALDDWGHPCQMLADFLTIAEKKGGIKNMSNLKFCYIGDCHNNVTYDLMRGASILNFKQISICGPVNKGKQYAVDNEVIKECEMINNDKNKVLITDDYKLALNDADVIYTDSWMSYGISKDLKEERIKVLMPYQVDSNKLLLGKKDCIFMNCLPALRGYEQTAEVIDGNQSVVFDQAENRLHAQKALLLFLVNGHMNPL